MSLIGIFYGSDTGNTENVANQIQKHFGELADVYDVAKSSKEDIEKYSILFFGIPTWYYGEAQADWEDFFPTIREIDFSERVVAIFGCGDQEDYEDYFCDSIGELAEIVEEQGGTIIGYTSTEGYNHVSSRAQIDDNTFCGLCIDEDRQPELTEQRVKDWCDQLKEFLEL